MSCCSTSRLYVAARASWQNLPQPFLYSLREEELTKLKLLGEVNQLLLFFSSLQEVPDAILHQNFKLLLMSSCEMG